MSPLICQLALALLSRESRHGRGWRSPLPLANHTLRLPPPAHEPCFVATPRSLSCNRRLTRGCCTSGLCTTAATTAACWRSTRRTWCAARARHTSGAWTPGPRTLVCCREGLGGCGGVYVYVASLGCVVSMQLGRCGAYVASVCRAVSRKCKARVRRLYRAIYHVGWR